MQHFKVKIDYGHKRMLWTPVTPIAPPKGSMGALFKRDKKGKVVVGSLYFPSDASAKGVKLNDEVVQFNGQPLNKYFNDSCSFYQWIFSLHTIQNLEITLKSGKKINLTKKQLGTRLWWKTKK